MNCEVFEVLTTLTRSPAIYAPEFVTANVCAPVAIVIDVDDVVTLYPEP